MRTHAHKLAHIVPNDTGQSVPPICHTLRAYRAAYLLHYITPGHLNLESHIYLTPRRLAFFRYHRRSL